MAPRRASGPDPRADQAIGSWEAAALMGIHWTQPCVMVRKGLLTARTLSTSEDESRSFLIYSSRQCSRDYEEYEERQANVRRRPRANLHMRPAGLRHLAKLEHPIAFDDAIGVVEAARILGVHWTFPPRMAKAGKIVGRLLHNGRADKSSADRLWIFSRRSCEANAAETKKLERAGEKIGRPRKKLA